MEMSGVNEKMLSALKALFASYKQLADSGDAGNWRIEDYPEGKQALEAIAAAEQGRKAEPVAYLKTASGVMQLSFEGNPVVMIGADVEVLAETIEPLYAHPPAVFLDHPKNRPLAEALEKEAAAEAASKADGKAVGVFSGWCLRTIKLHRRQ